MFNITIKQKLMIQAAISICGLIILFILSTQISKLGDEKVIAETLKADMLMLRRNEKDFILRKDLKYKDTFLKNIEKLQANSNRLKGLFGNQDVSTINKFDAIVLKYKDSFETYIKKQEEIGLHHEDGLYGHLRDSVHEVQTIAKEIEYAEALALVLDLRKHEKDFMLRRDLKYIDKFNKGIHTLNTLIQTSVIIDDATKQKMLNHLSIYSKDFIALVKAEEEIGLDSSLGIQGVMRKTIQESEDVLDKLYGEIVAHIKKTEQTMLIESIAVSLIVIAITLGLIIFIIGDISKSLRSFQNGMLEFFSFINKEKETIEDLTIRHNDEIGQMAVLVNENINKTKIYLEENAKFTKEITLLVEQIKLGRFDVRLNRKVSIPELDKLRQSFNIMLENLNSNIAQNTDKILDVLSSFKKLDFTKEIKNDNGKIAVALQDVTKLITTMLLENKQNGMTLENSSEILLKNVQALNKNSNNAAASLEETAAAIEEITSIISKNTNTVVQMASFASELTSSTKGGQKLASRTVAAMEDINTQVNSINEAITVIDQIAFQTNILSLNAAVEAATAGEAGKGFAVVAQEVRNLASRSAEAAKEIKDLVENATNKANDGKMVADEMIEGYDSLNKSISSTLELIEEIETSSKEQLSGIEQINNAISQLDKQTQQNANVASQTYKIAMQTDEISKLIVSSADEKEFIGKDQVKAK